MQCFIKLTGWRLVMRAHDPNTGKYPWSEAFGLAKFNKPAERKQTVLNAGRILSSAARLNSVNQNTTNTKIRVEAALPAFNLLFWNGLHFFLSNINSCETVIRKLIKSIGKLWSARYQIHARRSDSQLHNLKSDHSGKQSNKFSFWYFGALKKADLGRRW